MNVSCSHAYLQLIRYTREEGESATKQFFLGERLILNSEDALAIKSLVFNAWN